MLQVVPKGLVILTKVISGKGKRGTIRASTSSCYSVKKLLWGDSD